MKYYNKINPIVVIPVYKELKEWSSSEFLSFRKCLNVLKVHPICLFGPNNLDWTAIQQLAKTSLNVNVKIKKFDASFFENINHYNKLMLSSFFYESFRNYSHLLIYQLDAYVFRDELLFWCEQEYDYIGAPWNGTHFYNDIPIIGVGNGGFSLRNTKSALSLLNKLRFLEVLEQYKEFNTKGVIPRILQIYYKLYKSRSSPSCFEQNYSFQEDVFWGIDAPKRLAKFECKSKLLLNIASICIKNNFKIAPTEVAFKFSFETNPRILYKMYNGQLPFGCHAWEKYDLSFWKQFI